MSSRPLLDRTNKHHAEYFRAMADINYIVWRLSRETLATENAIQMPGFDKRNLQLLINPQLWKAKGIPQPNKNKHFSLSEQMGLLKSIRGTTSYPLLKAVELSIREPYYTVMQRMWWVTHNSTGIREGKLTSNDIRGMEIFASDYFLNLYEKAQALGNDLDYPTRGERSPLLEIENELIRGNNSGTENVMNLLVIEGTQPGGNFDATRTAMSFSKVYIENLPSLRNRADVYNIGWPNPKVFEDDLEAYALKNNKLVANRELLQEYGLGNAIGCIASLPPSEDTIAFCEQSSLKASRKTMLAEYVDFARPLVQKVLFKEALDPSIIGNIRPEDAQVIMGLDKRLSGIEGRCPYPHGGQESLTS